MRGSVRERIDMRGGGTERERERERESGDDNEGEKETGNMRRD